MKAPRAITVAMVRSPAGHDWQAEVQIEYKNTPGIEALRLSGDNPMQLIERAKNAMAKKFLRDGASQ